MSTDSAASQPTTARANLDDQLLRDQGLIPASEVAALLGVGESTIRVYMTRASGNLPEPALWARGYYWKREDVERVARGRDKQ